MRASVTSELVLDDSRTILGGNGISLEYPVIRHMVNLTSVLTYEAPRRCTN